MLELRHLRTLNALHSSGSLVRAAQLLNLTQSALSHQVRLMEERYGGPLFERKSVPIAFTATGSRLLELAGAVLSAVETAERDVVRLAQGDSGQLRVALECAASFDWLMPVMEVFRQRWPEVEIDLVSGFQGEPAQLLRRGQADLVIGAACGPDATVLPLFRAEIMVVLPPRHRLAAQRRIHAADLAGETLITYPVTPARVDLIREVLAPAGIHCEQRMTELTGAIVQLVASRRGIAALPAWAIREQAAAGQVLARPLGPDGLWRTTVASVAPAMAGRAYVGDFVSVIREQCARRLDGITLLG